MKKVFNFILMPNYQQCLIAVERDEGAAVVVAQSVQLVSPMSVQFGDRAEELTILNC